jgi:hypothetical protein
MAVYYIGAMAVGDNALMHYRTKGSRNGVSTTQGYRAIGERAKGRLVNGRYVYDYDQTPAYRSPSYKMGSAVSSGLKKVNSTLSGIGQRNTQRRQQNSSSYLGKKASSAANSLSKVQSRIAADTMHAQTRQAHLNPGKYTQAGMKADLYTRYAWNQVKRAAVDTRDWASRKMDWAGQQVRSGLSAARTFISNLLKKIGSSAQFAAKWAGQKIQSGVRSFGRSSVGKAVQPYVEKATKGRSNPGRIVYNAQGKAIRVGRDVYGNTTSNTYSQTRDPKRKRNRAN